jgi:hypothetical protein
MVDRRVEFIALFGEHHEEFCVGISIWPRAPVILSQAPR